MRNRGRRRRIGEPLGFADAVVSSAESEPGIAIELTVVVMTLLPEGEPIIAQQFAAGLRIDEFGSLSRRDN